MTLAESARRARWTPQPKAELLLRTLLEEALRKTPDARRFQASLLEACAIRVRDIVDHVAMPTDADALAAAGWERAGPDVWRHYEGRLPEIVAQRSMCIALRVGHLERFLRLLGVDTPIEGAAHGPFRRARVFTGDGVAFDAVERNGWTGARAPPQSERRLRRARLHEQTLRTRRRQFRNAESGLFYVERLVDGVAADLGPDWACALFMRAELEHWASLCETGAFQKRRQDRAGVGWCNIDHYAYCVSREHLQQTVRLLGKLGCEWRETLHAGAQAGWGAHVFEQPALRYTIMLETDLEPHEAAPGPACEPLSPLTWLRRAGLWSALHGESILEGGLRHVAGLYDADALRRLLHADGFAMMPLNPVDTQLCRQEATESQRRAVDPRRVDALERAGYLLRDEAENLRLNGAMSSHLRCVERRDAFMGFDEFADEAPSSTIAEPRSAPPRRPRMRVRLRR